MANRFYVYELSDPRTGVVFYVGKGTGKRAQQHAADVRNGRVRNARKHQRIMAIFDAGLVPIVKIVADNLSEPDAFCFERDRIRHYGYQSLTNIQPGTLTAMEKSKVEAEISIAQFKPHEEWLRERHRSDFEIDLALRIRAEMESIAQNGQVTEVIVGPHGIEFR